MVPLKTHSFLVPEISPLEVRVELRTALQISRRSYMLLVIENYNDLVLIYFLWQTDDGINRDIIIYNYIYKFPTALNIILYV